MPKGRSKDPVLDSRYFTGFELTHAALKDGLRAASDLSITQYRVLMKLQGLAPQKVRPSHLGELLDLKPNRVTQSVDALAQHGFAQREDDPDDARACTVAITEAGVEHILLVNKSLVAQLYALFPTENPTNRRLLEASISAGAATDPPASPKIARINLASRTLVSLELFRQMVEGALKQTVNAGYSECRLVQRLGESDVPMRTSDLSRQLVMPAATVSRVVDRLEARGWAQRLVHPDDAKAVFVGLTDNGRAVMSTITQEVADVAHERLWSKLSDKNRDAFSQVGHVVLADIRKREEVERKQALDSLEPLHR